MDITEQVPNASTHRRAQDTPPKLQPGSSWLKDAFHRIALSTSRQVGRPWAFIAALSIVIGWAVSGPIFGFTDTWQLVINTGTTIITFLMVFLIQSTQNRDSRALHLKLDELIVSSHARNVFADLEDASEAELDAFEAEFRQLRESGVGALAAAKRARGHLRTPPKHKPQT